MSRCIACNRRLSTGTMDSKHPITGKDEDMCSRCRAEAHSLFTTQDIVYPHQDLSEGEFTPKSNSGYYYEFFDD